MSSNDVITSVTSTEVTVSIVIVSVLLLLVICNLLMYTLTRMLTDPKFCVRQMVQRCTQKVPRVRVLEVHPKPRTPSVTGQSHADLISLLSHSANLQLEGVPRETTPSLQLSDSATADIFLSSSLQEDRFIKELAPAYAKGEPWKGDNINMTITCEMQKVEFIKEENQAKSRGITPDTGEITPVTKSDLHLPLSEKQMQTITEVDESKQSGDGQKHSVLSQPKVLNDTEKVVTKDSNNGKESPPKGDNSNTSKSDRRTLGKTDGEPVVRQKHGKIMEKTDKERDENGSTDKLKKESVKPKLAVTSVTKRADNTSNSSNTGSSLTASSDIVTTGNNIDTRTISAGRGTTGTGNDLNSGQDTVSDTGKQQVVLTNKYDTPVIKFFKEMKKEIVETSEQTTGNDSLVTDGEERNKEIGRKPGENSQHMEVNKESEGKNGIDRKTEGQNDKEKDSQATQESSMGLSNKGISVINDSNDTLKGLNGKNNRRDFDSYEQSSVGSAEGKETVGERTNNKDGKERNQNGEVEKGNHTTDIGDVNDGHGEGKLVSSGVGGDREGDFTTSESSDTGVGHDQNNLKTDTGAGQDQNNLRTDTGAGQDHNNLSLQTQGHRGWTGSEYLRTDTGAGQDHNNLRTDTGAGQDHNNLKTDTGVGQDQNTLKTDTGVGQDQNTLRTDTGDEEDQIKTEKENETSGDTKSDTKSDLGSDNAKEDINDVQKAEDNKSAEETDIEKDLNEYIRSNTMDTNNSEDKVDESDERVVERVDDKNDDCVDKREDYTRVDDKYDDKSADDKRVDVKSDDKQNKWEDDSSDKRFDFKVDDKSDDKDDKKADDKSENVKRVKDKENTKVNDKANEKGDDKVGKASMKDVKSKTQNKRSKQETVTTKTQTVRARNNKRFKQLKLAK
ncbi:protein starmaker-like [Argopecten irradians]|uniref:protein starmaker-like n=1 Tax=Argopecten irradians TaxID=31199 RepID=UPI003715F6A5